MGLLRRVSQFGVDLREGQPFATFVAQNAPLTFLVPISLIFALGDGTALIAAATWMTGAGIFNLMWFPYLRRGAHPPLGASQSVATATSAVGAVVVPETWLLLIVFIAIGMALGFTAGGRRHEFFQLLCLLGATYLGMEEGVGAGYGWIVFAVWIGPLGFAAISFVSAVMANRERQVHLTLEASGGTAWDVDSDGVVQDVLGVPFGDVVEGTRLEDLIHPDDSRPAFPEPGSTIEYRIRRGDGEWRWVRESVGATPGRRAERRSGVVDMTEEKAAIAEDRYRASTDQLTRRPNRASHIRQADRWAQRATGSLVLVDLDDFKHINDTLGHSVGDVVLMQVADRLASVDDDVHVARLGGDEFACLVPGDVACARRIASLQADSVRSPLSIDSMIVHSGVSAGIAEFVPGVGADEIRRRAGVALRAAKEEGGAIVTYDSELEVRSARYAQLAKDLPSVLAQKSDEIIVLLQPKCDLKTGEIVGYEALVRWDHPEFGRLLPEDFLDLVAVGGHHRALYSLVLERALASLTIVIREQPDVGVSVNLDARNLREGDLVKQTLAQLDAFGLEPRHLILELTEEAIVGEDHALTSSLFALHDAGIELSVDDFGTGFSSLSYLNRLPVSEVKLDRSIVSEVSRSERGRAVVDAVVGLAIRLNMRVVAEGIEDEESMEYLRSIDCGFGQGYLIGMPAPVDAWIQAEATFSDVVGL